MKKFLKGNGGPNQKLQDRLAEMIDLGYRQGVGELIYGMVTCLPDFLFTTVKLAQFSAYPKKNRTMLCAIASSISFTPKQTVSTIGVLPPVSISKLAQPRRSPEILNTFILTTDQRYILPLSPA